MDDKLTKRLIYGFGIGGGFLLILYLGPLALLALISFLQMRTYGELLNHRNSVFSCRADTFDYISFLLTLTCYYIDEPFLMMHILGLYTLLLLSELSYLCSKKALSLMMAKVEFAIWRIGSSLLIILSSYHATLAFHDLRWFAISTMPPIINDVSAYFCGKRWGKNKMSALSPNKTWEGFVGAMLCTTVFTIIQSFVLFNYELKYALHGAIIGVYISVLSTISGYIASTAKRMIGIKDFGDFIPGHGGIIDRMDSQLFTGLFVYTYLKFNNIFSS